MKSDIQQPQLGQLRIATISMLNDIRRTFGTNNAFPTHNDVLH